MLLVVVGLMVGSAAAAGGDPVQRHPGLASSARLHGEAEKLRRDLEPALPPAAHEAVDGALAKHASAKSWSLKGNPTKGCKWVDRKPDDRCGKKSHDLVRAYDACPSACAAYVSASSAVHDAAHLTPWAAEAADVLKGAGLV